MLQVRNGALLLRSKPYSGIGVTYFDAFLRHVHDEADTSFEAGFAALAEHNIPFTRFCCGGFWPKDWQQWQTNRKGYFIRLDRVFASAQKHGIGLIPSVCWNLSTFPDLVEEPCDQWGNPQSRTQTMMRRYVGELAGRYASHPALWAWEFGNEYNLPADLPNASDHRPQVAVEMGTAKTRTQRDELTHEQVRAALAAFGREVRKYDKSRVIFSGNSIPRTSAWHQKAERSWKKDSPAQFQEMLRADNPDPLDTLTVHAYEDDDFARLPDAARAAQAARKPLFVGEFGVSGPRTPESERRFAAQLAALRQNRVPLAALWVYDFKHQPELSVTATNERAWQLKALAPERSYRVK